MPEKMHYQAKVFVFGQPLLLTYLEAIQIFVSFTVRPGQVDLQFIVTAYMVFKECIKKFIFHYLSCNLLLITSQTGFCSI